MVDPENNRCRKSTYILCVYVPLGSPVAMKLQVKGAEKPELHFGTLLPFKNHEDGLKALSYAVTNYTSEPAPKHFAEALAAVIADKNCKPPQTNPLGIIPAWESYKKVRPLIFSKKAVMSAQEIALKDAVDKRFITYMQLCSILLSVVPYEVA